MKISMLLALLFLSFSQTVNAIEIVHLKDAMILESTLFGSDAPRCRNLESERDVHPGELTDYVRAYRANKSEIKIAIAQVSRLTYFAEFLSVGEKLFRTMILLDNCPVLYDFITSKTNAESFAHDIVDYINSMPGDQLVLDFRSMRAVSGAYDNRKFLKNIFHQ